MPATEMVVAVALMAGITLLIISVLRFMESQMVHKTVRTAFETNPDLAPGLLEKITSRPSASAGGDRLAWVLIAIGLAMAIAPLIAVDDRGLVRAAIGASLFPLLVGAALWLRFRAAQRAMQRDRSE